MKSYHIQMGKGLAGLTIKEHDIPVPGPGEALFISENRLKPVIDRIFDFDDAESALIYFKEESRFGKVVISLNN